MLLMIQHLETLLEFLNNFTLLFLFIFLSLWPLFRFFNLFTYWLFSCLAVLSAMSWILFVFEIFLFLYAFVCLTMWRDFRDWFTTGENTTWFACMSNRTAYRQFFITMCIDRCYFLTFINHFKATILSILTMLFHNLLVQILEPCCLIDN